MCVNFRYGKIMPSELLKFCLCHKHFLVCKVICLSMWDLEAIAPLVLTKIYFLFHQKISSVETLFLYSII